MKQAPLPGRRVRGSRTGRPIMAALDLLGRRWSLRVVWELREGACTFRELQARCGDVSPTSLNARLHELREAGLVERGREDSAGYGLSPLGAALIEALAPLSAWSQRWAEARGRRSTSNANTRWTSASTPS